MNIKIITILIFIVRISTINCFAEDIKSSFYYVEVAKELGSLDKYYEELVKKRPSLDKELESLDEHCENFILYEIWLHIDNISDKVLAFPTGSIECGAMMNMGKKEARLNFAILAKNNPLSVKSVLPLSELKIACLNPGECVIFKILESISFPKDADLLSNTIAEFEIAKEMGDRYSIWHGKIREKLSNVDDFIHKNQCN
jgi:hypothetical protein